MGQWWKFVSIGIVLAWLFELYPVNAHWWYYYGEGQPLMFLGLTMWWGPAAVLGASLLTFVLRRKVLRNRLAAGFGDTARRDLDSYDGELSDLRRDFKHGQSCHYDGGCNSDDCARARDASPSGPVGDTG